MTLTCERCGSEFKRRQKDRANRFCSAACYNASGRPVRRKSTRGPRMRRAPGHPLAPPSGTVAECRLVLYEKVGPGTHRCHWCDAAVTWMPGEGLAEGALIADHLDWNPQNNDPANLVPSCNRCNVHRTKEEACALIRSDELAVTYTNGTRHRAIEKPCEFCGSPFVVAMAQIKQGKGRFCSRSCARRKPHVAR